MIRLAEAVDAIEGRAVTMRLFGLAGLEHYVSEPPAAMVREEEVTVLHRHCRKELNQQRAASVSWIAGLRTADYLLGNRIPKFVQRLLKLLPARLSAFILLKAIERNAWTFAGSSRFTWRWGRVIRLAFEDCPLCRGGTASAPAATITRRCSSGFSGH